ncbi:MAG: HD domain-containing protein, partial [Candidatus ainarchaeum sp.]|nr:HD domain-containing protein [Candidatus ainarchaeum sp.]
VELTDFEERIVDTSDFQRLRRIRQLATANLVYPGANHSRFEHSLGTLHLASRIAEKLSLDEGAEKLRLYALLHDIGHIAFSHEAERITSKHLGTHEEIGAKKMLSGELADILLERLSRKEIAGLDNSVHAEAITSDIGADRMDYLKRDAYYTGVAYGMVDEQRIIGKMFFEKGALGVEYGALEAAESLLVARFMMFSTVYFHHTVRIASAMLARSLSMAIGNGLDPKLLLEKGDAEVLALLAQDKQAGKYSKAIEERKLYKQVYSLSPSQFKESEVPKLEAELSSLAGCDILIDVPDSFFKLSGFLVRTHSGKKEEISKISELVRSLKSTEESRKKALILAPAQFREKAEKECARFFS